MNQSPNLTFLVPWIAVTVSGGFLCGNAPAGQPRSEHRSALSQLAQETKQQFRVPQDAELAKTRAAVVKALTPVTDTLDRIPSGEGVKRQLGLDRLRQQLDSSQPDPDQLLRVCRALRQTRWEIAEADCQPLRQSTMRYASLLRRRSEQAKDEHTRQLDKLTESFGLYAAAPSAGTFEPIREAYTWLALGGHATQLRQSIRRQFSHPNKIVTISRPFLEKVMVREVTATQAVATVQQGTHIQGQMHVRGTLGLDAPPDDEALHLSIHFRAHADTPLSARRQRVSIGAHADSDFWARQSYFVTADGLDQRAPVTQLSHVTNLCSVQLWLRSRLARAVITPLARRVAQRQIAAHDPQLRQQAATLLQERLNIESHALVDQVNLLLHKFLWDPMVDRDIEADLRFRTTANQVEAVARLTTPWQLGAPGNPPAMPGNDTVLRFLLHQSAFNNTNVALAGIRWTDSAFDELFYQGLKLQPLESDGPDGPRIPVAITLADENPIALRFDLGRVSIRLRIKAFQDEEKEISDTLWTVSTAYRPTFDSGQLTVRRDEGVAIEPSETPHADRLRNVLTRFLLSGVVGQRRIEATSYRDGPQVRLGQFVLDDGWLGLGLVHALTDKQ